MVEQHFCPRCDRLMGPKPGTVGYDADGTEYQDVKSCLVCKDPVYGISPDGLVPVIRLGLRTG